MSKVTVDIGMALDGYVAGPDQSQQDPLGKGGENLHRWMFEDPESNKAALDGILAAGAFVMGRNMFGPDRGDWDLEWQGWWGPNPPFHTPTFVLTHHTRPPIEMQGGTTFHFVTDGIDAALARARAAAGEKNVAIAGGASTVNQYLAAGHVDELRIHLAPVLLGAGERLLVGVGDLQLEQLETTSSRLVTHLRYKVG